MPPHTPLAFIDLETTGANPLRDRVTEIGIVSVTRDHVERWSSLVNPGCRIPPFIQNLTGIDDAMVANAPSFADLAVEVRSRLAGRVFIAHNARFDFGFLKNEFQRLGQRFRADVVCTVKLSRALFPEHPKHNLDSLILRHGLTAGDRHRALADADLIWQFWQQIQAQRPQEDIQAALDQQLRRPNLPPLLDPAVLEDIPETPGVYLFYDPGGALLYVGKSVNLYQRVVSHFSAGSRAYKELRLNEQLARIEWQETVGELGALLLESRLIKTRQPVHNRQLRRASDLCAWRLVESGPGLWQPELVGGHALDPSTSGDLYGLFHTRREATLALRKIAEAHRLCPVLLGLESPRRPGSPCFAHQVHQCLGACVGKEAPGMHSARLMAALGKLKLAAWPYPGAIGLVERDEASGREEIHVVRHWCHLGTARDMADIETILGSRSPPAFDRDTYQILKKYLAGKPKVLTL